MGRSVSAEALALVEGWVREQAPVSLSTKALHILLELYTLSLYSYRERGQATCHPGRAYLAGLVGWSVWQVSRLTSKLRRWQVLTTQQDHAYLAQTGEWVHSTNTYTLVGFTEARIRQLAAVLGVRLPAPHGCAHMLRTSFTLPEKKKDSACERSGWQAFTAFREQVAQLLRGREGQGGSQGLVPLPFPHDQPG
jgi:hypothetical protein